MLVSASKTVMSTALEEVLNLLIVDDDAVDRMALSRALKSVPLKTSISEAGDVDDALSLIGKSEPDCIFLDYHLPGKNGLDLIKQIRHMGIQVPLIVLTGQGSEQTAVELMKAGASDYLPKSKLSTEAISRLLRSAMRVYRAERSLEDTNRRLREKNQLLEQKNAELKRQRRHIYKQNLQLQEVSRLKSEFLATMSHELRTPLNAIIGFSQILINKTKGPLTDYQEDMLSRVLSNGKNLLELINDILAFSRIEAGRLELEPISFELPKLVYSTVEELRSLATQKSIALEVDVALSEPTVVNDAVRVRQIIVNLLSNAIKFTAKGTVRVLIEPSHQKAEDKQESPSDELNSQSNSQELNNHNLSSHDEKIVISVEDTGCGISALDQVYIFDAFHQSDQKVTRKHSGTGLGLAITHSLVDMMGGEIVVDSEVGKGSTFRVTLPKEVKVSSKENSKSYRENSKKVSTEEIDRDSLSSNNVSDRKMKSPSRL